MDDITITEPDSLEPTESLTLEITPGRHRSRVVMLVSTGVLVALTAVALVIGGLALSSASRAHSEEAKADHARRVLAGRARDATLARHDLEHRMTTMDGRLDALGTALDALAAAQNHSVDVANHGVDLYNQGDSGGATAVFAGDGAAALADQVQKDAAVQQAMRDAQQALEQLQEAL